MGAGGTEMCFCLWGIRVSHFQPRTTGSSVRTSGFDFVANSGAKGGPFTFRIIIPSTAGQPS